jgi:valyl-tRNA synthetase
VLAFVLEGTLKLLHPFMPHITEEIWHTLTQSPSDLYLALQAYPEVNAALLDPSLEDQFNQLIDTIRTIRNLRAEAEIKPGVKIPLILQSDSEAERQILAEGQIYIQDLAKVDQLSVTAALDAGTAGAKLFAGVTGTVQVLIPLAGVVDIAALRAKLEKDLN